MDGKAYRGTPVTEDILIQIQKQRIETLTIL
jgi:hypothetical protein